MDTSGMFDLHRTHEITSRDQTGDALHVDASQHDFNRDGIAIVIRIGRLTCRHMELSGASDLHQTAISIGRLRKRVEESHDHGAIELRSSRDHGSFIVESIHDR